ncbi:MULTISPECIES: hypothetical protein [unclassified Microbacterium]|uniref:hypothetical protein n=1 Tax=Microbacterium TaxID=33882 RepID=UPI003BA0A4CB
MRTRSSRVFAIASIVATLAIPFLFCIYFSVYFSLGGPAPSPTSDEIIAYELAAGIAVAASVVAGAAAVFRESAWRVVVAMLLAVLVLGAAYVFAVPHLRWAPAPAPATHELPGDYVPCYGEGDPNCAAG